MTHWKHIFARPREGFAIEALRHLPWLLLTAVLLALAFPKPGWSWLAHIALVPAVVLTLRSQSPRILAITMYLVFAIWWVWMIRWLMPVTGGGAVGLGMFMAVYWTAALLLVRHLHKAFRSAMVITLPLVWVTFELWRGWLPQGGFGWFCLGHSQAPWQAGDAPGWIIQIADLFGQPGVSFLVVMTNGLIVDLLTRPLFRRQRQGHSTRPMHQRVSKTLTVATLLWLCCMLGAMGYGMFRFNEEKTLQQRRPVTAAVIQTAVPQSNKQASHAQRTGQGEAADQTVEAQQRQQEEDDWQAMIQMTRQAAAMQPKPALIVWPETMIPRPVNPMAVSLFEGFDDPARPEFSQQVRSWPRYHEQISFLSRDLNTNLMVGASSMLFTVGKPGYDTANSVFLYDWRGMQSELRYDKMHRVPFGEYMPWVESVGWLKKLFIEYLSPYKFDYSLTPGARPVIFPLMLPPLLDGDDQAGATDFQRDLPLRVVSPICFEDTVPRLVRSMVYQPQSGEKRAELIANLTNDGWFAGTHQPWQHLQIAVYRSIELRVPTMRAVNMGVSGFVDSMGRIGPLAESDGQHVDVQGIAITTVMTDPRETFYGQSGPWGSVIIAIVTGLLVAGGAYRRLR